MTILCWQVEGVVEGFVGVLFVLYFSLDNRRVKAKDVIEWCNNDVSDSC